MLGADGHPPETKNPWDPSRTPGGSSTGSAVAVATRMLPYALGTQTVGSVLRPAAYNGIVGLKPTYGLISRTGVIPQSDSCDTIGILCRNVKDAGLSNNMQYCLFINQRLHFSKLIKLAWK